MDEECQSCKHWKHFATNQQWGTCKAITDPENALNSGSATMCANIEPQDAADCLESIEFETARKFGCKLWEDKP